MCTDNFELLRGLCSEHAMDAITYQVGVWHDPAKTSWTNSGTSARTRCRLMGDFGKMFEWIDFPQGRIRYAGGTRGRDEPPISTFAVELRGLIYYGEIRRLFLADRNNYKLELVSFGWMKDDWFGIDPDPPYCAAFTPEELGKVLSLICHVVPAWRHLEDRPSILTEYADAHFMGQIIFRKGWALVKETERAYG